MLRYLTDVCGFEGVGVGRRYALKHIRRKIGIRMACKDPDWESSKYAIRAIRYGLWERTFTMSLEKASYAVLDTTIMIEITFP